jgi:hypothetical protein
MSAWLNGAGATVVLLLVVHSVAGELLLMRPMRKLQGFPPLLRSESLAKGTVHATWHIASLLGAGIAVILFALARKSALGDSDRVVVWAIAASMLASAVLTAILSRLRHPGWIGFSIVAVLCALGARA